MENMTTKGGKEERGGEEKRGKENQRMLRYIRTTLPQNLWRGRRLGNNSGKTRKRILIK